MHTSAPHPTTTPLAQFSGRLLANAEVRVRPVGQGGQMMPVLCLDLEPDNAPGHVIHAEQVFPVAAHQAAEHRAHKLVAGIHVTVDTPTEHLRLVLPHCRHVHVTPNPPISFSTP